ncbi:hypothetical protein T492DRAFT_979497 [Pavlovales sp. CCMP2436]|nr:hypothetical protein T492DRAFT_979497 [Pavlovales sp. CCMP2436]
MQVGESTTWLSHARARAALALAPAAREPLARLRARLLAFLSGEGAFLTLHDRRTGASLGEHLLGTFDLLVDRRAEGPVCAAGALHSIYGTNVFLRATVLPTRERRDAIARTFGKRAEHLVFLFHSCRRPGDLDRGVLTSRCEQGFTWSPRDVVDLRLMEAANLAEQGSSLERWPAVRTAWETATSDADAGRGCELRAQGYSARMLLARGVQLLVGDAYVLRLSCAGRELDVEMPVRPADPRVAEWLLSAAALSPAAQQAATATGVGAVAFVLKGEARYGMPACALELLNAFGPCVCAGLAFERRLGTPARLEVELVLRTGLALPAAQPLPPPHAPPTGGTAARVAVPLSALLPGAGEPARSAAAAALLAQLRTRGWAKLAMAADATERIEAAYSVMRALAPVAGSELCERFDGGRYAGAGRDFGRVWINWRAGMESDAFRWPEHARAERGALACAFSECEAAARVVLGALLLIAPVAAGTSVGGLLGEAAATVTVRGEAVPPGAALHLPVALAEPLAQLGAAQQQLAASRGALLAAAASSQPQPPAEGAAVQPCETAERGERRFGASVQRFLVCCDRPERAARSSSASSAHADMGLLTLAPPSSFPALELFEPASGARVAAEEELWPGEWVLFAGETLSFLTGGALQAPVHRVPWVERGARPQRCAAPFFLRAAPWATVRDPSGAVELSCRQLIERHCATRRPWRRLRAGMVDIGDW